MLDQSLLGGFPLRRHKAGVYTLQNNLEEIDRVFGAVNVKGYVRPAVEVPPLEPGGGIFIEDCRRESLGDIFLFSIVVI